MTEFFIKCKWIAIKCSEIPIARKPNYEKFQLKKNFLITPIFNESIFKKVVYFLTLVSKVSQISKFFKYHVHYLIKNIANLFLKLRN